MSHWLVSGLRARRWNVLCIDSRVMPALLSLNVNKTDRNDARTIANAIRCNNYKEVHLKSVESIKINCVLTARKTLIHQKIQLSNTIRGILKTFGLKLPTGRKSIRKAIKFSLTSIDVASPEEKKLIAEIDWSVIETLITCHGKIEGQLDLSEAKLCLLVKNDPVIQCFMTHPGVGPVTAATYKAEIDDPTRFKKSRSVGAYLGMTSRQFSSGETVRMGRVSKNGPSELKALLHEAGVVVITRTKKKSRLKTWGLKKKIKLKTQKAGMAVGRKIAVNLHRMWIEGRNFDPQIEVEEFSSEETKKKRKKQPKA